VPERRDLGRCLVLGLVNAVHLGLQAYGLLHTSAIRTGWIIAVIPVSIALGGQLFLGKRLTRMGWLGALVAMAGVFGVTMKEPPDLANARIGDLLQLVSCVTWTVYTLASAKPVASSGALRTTAAALLVAAPLATLAAVAVGPVAGTSVRDGLFHAWPPGAEALGAAAFLGLACSGLAYWLWVSALQRDGPARIAAMLYFQPFVTLAASLVWRGEPFTWTALVAGPIVLLGVYLVGRGSPQRTNVLRTRLERST
jgi:drug/metabolite transporter (DMT)-like permease